MTDVSQQTLYDPGRSGLVLLPEHWSAIDEALADLLDRAPARFILLVDQSGQVVAAHGEREGLDLLALGALVAGDVAAGQEIARLAGEYQDYQLVVREGRATNLLMAQVGERLALLAQVAREEPLGWVRVLVNAAARRVAAVVQDAPAAATREAPGLALGDDDLANLLGSELDALWAR
jgi:predicted regulator of Ras-like GTPase activity (Roadblock/LC7/MglB family)